MTLEQINPITLMVERGVGRDILEKGPESNEGWIVVLEDPSDMVLGLNIRERDDDFVTELAKNILSQGQIQECTGDTLSDGRIRVWAGQHRFWAIERINGWIDEYNKGNPDKKMDRFKLRVRVRQREMTETEILQVQIAENLHKDMEPEEEAEAINSVFTFYLGVIGEDASVADFARRVGLGEAKVGNAIKYIGLEQNVKELVERDALLYSVATKISRVPVEKQFVVAMQVILHDLSRQSADALIRQTLGEEEVLSIFKEYQKVELERESYRLVFRRRADRAARDAAGYFKRVTRLLDLVDDPTRVTMTDTIRDILSSLIESAYRFQIEIEEEAPQLYDSINRRVLQMIANDK